MVKPSFSDPTYQKHVFYMMLYFHQTTSHIERYWIIFHWFASLRGYLPVKFEDKPEFYNNIILPRLETIVERLTDCRKSYKASFEGEHSFDPDEEIFIEKLGLVLIDLAELGAVSKIFEGMKGNFEEVTF